MSNSGPTLVSLEAGSAWTVIVVVSLLTAPAALFLRRVINRPGGLASGVLLTLPLALPVIAASIYHQGLLPEVAMFRPATSSVLKHSGKGLLHYLFVVEGRERVIPYALSGHAGRWLMLAGLAATSFMLVRRILGGLMLCRAKKRALLLEETPYAHVRPLVDRLSRAAGLRHLPDVLVLRDRAPIAAAMGIGRGRILLSEQLFSKVADDELEAVLAHEIAHVAANDVRLVVVAGILRDLVAWNPIGHLAFRRLQLHRELEADRRAAAITGKPLTVASALINVWGLSSATRRASVSHTVPAILSRERALPKRVSGLLALADGRVSTTTAAFPYFLAVLAVVALGLAAGSGIAGQRGPAFAIMLGDAPTADRVAVWNKRRDVWRMRMLDLSRDGNRHRVTAAPQRRPAKAAATRRRVRFDAGFALRMEDVGRWSKWTTRLGASEQALQWEAEQIRVFSQASFGPVGLFRIQQRPDASVEVRRGTTRAA